MKTCPTCSKEFNAYSAKATYCSIACRQKAAIRRRIARDKARDEANGKPVLEELVK